MRADGLTPVRALGPPLLVDVCHPAIVGSGPQPGSDFGHAALDAAGRGSKRFLDLLQVRLLTEQEQRGAAAASEGKGEPQS